MFEFGRQETEKPLGNNWLHGLLDRWTTIQSTWAWNATPETIQNYYRELKKILDKYNLKSSPERIYSIDETGL